MLKLGRAPKQKKRMPSAESGSDEKRDSSEDEVELVPASAAAAAASKSPAALGKRKRSATVSLQEKYEAVAARKERLRTVKRTGTAPIWAQAKSFLTYEGNGAQEFAKFLMLEVRRIYDWYHECMQLRCRIKIH